MTELELLQQISLDLQQLNVSIWVCAGVISGLLVAGVFGRIFRQ